MSKLVQNIKPSHWVWSHFGITWAQNGSHPTGQTWNVFARKNNRKYVCRIKLTSNASSKMIDECDTTRKHLKHIWNTSDNDSVVFNIDLQPTWIKVLKSSTLLVLRYQKNAFTQVWQPSKSPPRGTWLMAASLLTPAGNKNDHNYIFLASICMFDWFLLCVHWPGALVQIRGSSLQVLKLSFYMTCISGTFRRGWNKAFFFFFWQPGPFCQWTSLKVTICFRHTKTASLYTYNGQ